MSEGDITKEGLERQKLTAEIARLKAETNEISSYFSWWLKVARLVGVGILGAGGVIAAFTTYQVTEQKAEVAKVHLEQANSKLLDTETKLQTKQLEISGLEDAIATKKAALAETQKLAEATEAKIKQSQDELAQRLRSGQLPADVRSEVNRTVAAQEAFRRSAQETAKRASAGIDPTDEAPMVLVFAAPGDTEQGAVQALATTLEQNGFTLGQKRVFSGKPPNGVTEVRFFRNPEDREEAKKILGILKSSAHLSDGRISFVIDHDIRRSRYFEVRLAKASFLP
jgi:hypothetical protein